jgi:hypothetical protein
MLVSMSPSPVMSVREVVSRSTGGDDHVGGMNKNVALFLHH